MNHVMADGAPAEPGWEDEDTRLLVASRRDNQAFEDLYRRNWDRVLAYFYRRILCPHTSSEMAAETFAQAFASRHRYDPAGGTGIAWIFGIAGNLYRDWLRRAVVVDRARRKYNIEPRELGEEDIERIENLIDVRALQQGLREALDSLTPKLRDAVLLRVAMDMPYEQVASALGCSVGAARVRVSRGLETLLEHMETS